MKDVFILIGLSFHIFYKLINLTDQILIKNAVGNALYPTASLIFLLMFLKPLSQKINAMESISLS